MQSGSSGGQSGSLELAMSQSKGMQMPALHLKSEVLSLALFVRTELPPRSLPDTAPCDPGCFPAEQKRLGFKVESR